MAGREPNLKVNVTTDTRDVNKGLKEVKQDLKDLDKTGNQALASIGTALGVDTGKIGQMASAVRGLGERLTQTGNEGAKAFGSLLKSIGPVQAGIAGLGLAAAIAGFKALKAEADNFKSTIDGMNLSMGTAAYLSTYRQVLHDVNSETGKQVAEAMTKWEEGFGRFKANLGATLTTFMTSSTLGEFGESMKGLRQSFRDARDSAEQARALGSEQADQMKEQLALNYEIKQIDADIAALRRDANDKSKSAADREAARVAYLDKVNEKYDKQRDLAERMAATQEAMDDLASNTFEDTQKTYELKGKILEIDANRESELKAVDRLEHSIAGSTSKAAEAAQKYREEVAKMAEMQQKWSGLGTVSTDGLSSLQGGVMGPTLSIIPKVDAEYWRDTITAQLGEVTIGIGFKADTEKIHDISNEVNSLMESSVARTSELIGSLVGTLAGGGDAWGDFKSAALSAFGDMAIAVGKIAISAGVASEGIKAALKLDNPYVAIAAGAALIALGTAVKSSLSAVANGDYSAAGGGYTSGYSSGSSSNNWEAREVNVNVTGTLVADGDQLKAALNSANKKAYYTD